MARRAAAPPPKVDRPPVAPPTPWVEVDLGDSELLVREHADGMFTIEIDGARLIANADEMQPIAVAFAALAAAKGWQATEATTRELPTMRTDGAGSPPPVARGARRRPRDQRPTTV